MPSNTGIVASGVSAGDTFIMPYRQDVMGWSSVDGSGGMTYTRGQSSSALGGGYGQQASAADADDGDYMEWSVNLAAGTYTLTHIGYGAGDRGMVDWKLDGTTLGNLDFYSGVVWNVVKTITGIVVGADGNYTLRAQVNGKNASGTDYFLTVFSVTLHRTGA